jgi:CRP/FNR family cyclic AMP-dependent transcriptional regulator
MSLHPLSALLADNPLFQGLPQPDLELIAGCAANARFEAGDFLFREGQPADTFYLLRYGKVSIEFFAPGRGAISLHTRGEGDVIGWSWLFPPHVWSHDARAHELVRGIAFDGACLRAKLEHDPRLGYELMKRFGHIVHQRLDATRLQLLDLYGDRRAAAPR